MEIFKSIILGIIQGLTEFFPVSSSAHLIIFPYFFKWNETTLFFAVALHFATLLSLLSVLYRDVISIIKAFFKGIFIKNNRDDENFRLSLCIVISLIPAGIFGFLFHDTIENIFSVPIYSAVFLIITALILILFEFFGEKHERDYINRTGKNKNINYLIALVTGLGQAFAILPGVSRSGTTISTSRIFGIKREEAVKFSFLISIPIIFGSFIFELYGTIKKYEAGNISFDNTAILSIIIGFIFAYISGFFAVKFLMRYAVNKNLNFFAAYCILVSVTFFIVYFIRK
jgi:undecaprenyl-diphosphatase